ncbi:MAG: D-aminoacylase [Thermoanaerobaculia bacterium]|nr:D-aminoacylase [Thermoanaerobaculia bacterium]
MRPSPLSFALTLAAALVLSTTAFAAPSDTPCDLLITNGRIVDGTGAPWFRGDVCVADGRINAIQAPGKLAGRSAKRTIDATGLVVSPGFIDLLGQSEYAVLVDPRAASKITQGITTEITGEGSSIAPTNERQIAEGEDAWKHYGVRPDWTDLDGYFRAFEKARPAINLGTLVGAGGVRDLVVGKENRPATPKELAEMESLVDTAMRQGAFGLSTSLQYVPGRFASTAEIVALAKVAAKYGGVYFTHQRSEQREIDASMDEVMTIAREAAIPANIWHFKTACRENWGRMPEMLAKVAAGRAAGLDVAANQYPWTAGMNSLIANLPPWAQEGGAEATLARLKDPATRAKIKEAMRGQDPSWENQFRCAGGAEGVLVAGVLDPKSASASGKTIADLAKERGVDPEDALFDLLIADHLNTSNILFIMDDKDVETALADPMVAFCTDSGAGALDGVLAEPGSHPRGWGSAPRILGHYVREKKLLSLEEAVRKMTSLPASRAGLQARGILRPGMKADLVVFDPETIGTRATYTDPNHYADGIPYVAVNGQLVVDGGKITDARPGVVLRGPGYRAN